MRYVSSRDKERKEYTAAEAIISGLAADGGLFTPLLTEENVDVENLLNCSYQEIALKVMSVFLTDFEKEELQKLIASAYDDKFDSQSIVPLQKYEDRSYLMELWHGPTLAFKDIALTILPYLLKTSLKICGDEREVMILTATSGDTGKAALSGFRDVAGTSIIVFYPEEGVSDIQKLQMQTSPGKNVEVIAVKGNFDDCQKMVKELSLKEYDSRMQISSANSINLGRLVPQIVYYFKAYVDLRNSGAIEKGGKVSFAVPSGNFGDILAGYLAKEIGLPVNRLICASNSNNVLTRFIHTGIYDSRLPLVQTVSPSMDILVSSNLERLLYILSDCNAAEVNAYMDSLKKEGVYAVEGELKKRMESEFAAYWASEEECTKTIHDTWMNDHTLIDPHTACGVSALKQYRREYEDEGCCVVLSTASPYKFSQDVYAALKDETIEDAFEASEKLSALTDTAVPKAVTALKTAEVRFNRSIDPFEGYGCVMDKIKEILHD